MHTTHFLEQLFVVRTVRWWLTGTRRWTMRPARSFSPPDGKPARTLEIPAFARRIAPQRNHESVREVSGFMCEDIPFEKRDIRSGFTSRRPGTAKLT